MSRSTFRLLCISKLGYFDFPRSKRRLEKRSVVFLSLTKSLRTVRMLLVRRSDQFPVQDHRQICDDVLNSDENPSILPRDRRHSLLVSTLFAAPVDVVAQFTLISFPITNRLFIASSAFAAA